MIFIDNFLLFIFGSCIGSFINLARFRIPKNQSIMSPNSFCDNCKASLNWDEKIPIVSQLFLRKRCRSCNFKVPLKYSFIEIFSGVLFILNSQSTNFIFSSDRILDIFIKCFFVSNLFLISLIDIDTLTIPNKLNIFNYVLGFIIILFFSDFSFNLNIIFSRFLFSILTILLLESFSYLYFLIRGKIPFGSGDSKLLSVFVIWLGIKGMLIALIGSIYLAGIYIFIRYVMRLSKTDRIPFGPFLCLGSYLFLILGPDLPLKILFFNSY
jgi:leader peptidase (prepilin peptidase)/N-methyltransferase